jgi:uncharacterized protein (DUF427 family)
MNAPVLPGPATNPSPGFKARPDHSIKLEPFKGTVTVHVGGVEIARTKNAIVVREEGHSPVYYVPVEDIDGDRLTRSAHATRCAYKGTASYWNIVVGDHEIDNAVWAYETPYDEMLELAGLAAFFDSKVKVTAEPAISTRDTVTNYRD